MPGNKQKTKLVIVSLAALVLVASAFLTLTNPDLPRHFIGAGGESSGGGYTLTCSIGQHDAGSTMTGVEYKLSGGFWGAGGDINLPVYIPLMVK